MSELVLLHYNQPMTTSLAIAACTENEHDSVLLMVRKYVDEIREFGELVLKIADPGISRFEISGQQFEIENSRDKKGRPTEIAFLNEGQAMFLLTLMRNSPVVVAFKKALVKAFLELRDRVTQPSFVTADPAHGADLVVSADRTFRAYLRSARSSGLRLPAALQLANRLTLQRTGMDMLADMQIDPEAAAAQATALPDDLQPLRAWIDTRAESNVFYRLADIVLEAFPGLVGREFRGTMARSGPVLRAAGFRSKKMRLNGTPLTSYWFLPAQSKGE